MVVHEDQEKEDGSSCFPPGFGTTAAYAVQFSGVEGRNPTLVDPCNDSVHAIPNSGIIDAVLGKRCVACTGTNWFLVLDEVTRECFLTTLFTTAPPPSEESVAVVPLPPMPPEDPPKQLDFLFNCALSAPSPTAGCVVVLGLAGETYLRYCRLGSDEAWSQIDVTFDDYVDVFVGAVAFHGGKIYAATNASYCIIVDALSPAPAAPHVERADIKIPARYPNNLAMRSYLVVATASTSPNNQSGDLYFVRPYFFGFPGEVVDVDVCRWDPSLGAWREVDGIGDTTLFVGDNCIAVSPAGEEGTESDTIHVLQSSYDGVRVFTFSLADMTIRCSFVEIEEEEEEDKYSETNPPPATKAYWSVPSNCRFTFKLSRQASSEGDGQENNSMAHPDPPSECPRQWSSLPTDLLADHVVPKLSFIDFLNLKSVCKDWRSISTPIRNIKAWPLLVTPNTSSQSRNNCGSLDVFDPVTKNKYTLSVQVPSVAVPDNDDDLPSSSLVLHGSKNGWLVVSRARSFFLVNPFKRSGDAVVVLPPVNELFWFKGISFCSTPGSPDFTVMVIEGITSNQDMDTVRVRTWRPGQESWEQHEDFDCQDDRFLLATHNPLFLDGEFYCMARDGKLAAFDPKTKAWRVLDGLALPIETERYVLGEEGMYAYPVEWKSEVIAAFHDKDVQEPIDMFRLDRSRMAWEKLEDLKDGAMFWDRKQVIARPASSLAQNFSCNKVYLPTFTQSITSGGASCRECMSYSMETKEFSNGSCSLYDLKEPLKALWFEPNLDDYE